MISRNSAQSTWYGLIIYYISYAQLFLSFSWNVTNAQPLLWPVILSLRTWRSKIAPNWPNSSSSSVSVQSLGIWPTNNFMLLFASIFIYILWFMVYESCYMHRLSQQFVWGHNLVTHPHSLWVQILIKLYWSSLLLSS